LDEKQIIELFRNRFRANQKENRGLYDDVAYLERSSGFVLKVDMFVAGTDMVPGMTLSQAARKSVVACLSDISSKGARAFGFSLSLGIPRRIANRSSLNALAEGFLLASREFRLKLLSGDVNESRELVIDCVMVGNTERMVPRDGAKPGDIVFSTGPFGYTGLGLRHLIYGDDLPDELRKTCTSSVLEPKPNFWLSRTLVSSGLVSASMDSSDGLAATLSEIASQSGVGIRIENLPVDRVVLDSGLSREAIYRAALYGGEEYVTVLAVAPDAVKPIFEIAKKSGGELYRIGTVTKGSGVFIVTESGLKRVRPGGWVHFDHG
jgi:thiamine-monophosphate kinase